MVRNAPSRIHSERDFQGVHGAASDADLALAAVGFWQRRVVLVAKPIHQKGAYHEERAVVIVDQPVLAHTPYPGLDRPALFGNRRAIHCCPVLHGRIVVYNHRCQLYQQILHQNVVILNPRVTGRPILVGLRFGIGQIVVSHHDDGLAARQQRFRVEPAIYVPFQIVHFSMVAVLHGVQKLRLRLRQHPCTRNAAVLESDFFRP